MAKKLPDFRKFQNKYLKPGTPGLLDEVISFSGCELPNSTKGETKCSVCGKKSWKYTRKEDGHWYCPNCR